MIGDSIKTDIESIKNRIKSALTLEGFDSNEKNSIIT